MEKQSESPSQLRKCNTCGAEKEPNQFYKKSAECRQCILLRAHTIHAQNGTRANLELIAEKHKRKKILREELKKLAKEAFREKKVKRRKAAVKRLIPQIDPEYKETDSVTQELARRELARRKLIEFVKQFHPRYKAGWVHHDICKRLEKFSADVEAGLSPRLMLLMPPRHGKSQLASKLYPAWHLGHYPHHEFIGCSYNISLALDFSREIRDVIKSDAYETLYPKTRLNPDFMSAEAWRLKSETGVGAGGYNAAGVGGGITGKGAHILVIDDPVKNAEEAESPDIRAKIWDWYRSTAYTRLAPGGGVLVIQTWWNDDDLAGRIQKEMIEDPEADQFEIVKYPAIAEEDEPYRMAGEALHEERYNLEALLRIKRTLGDRYWSALYQQNPVSDEGAYFNPKDFVYRESTPPIDEMDIYQAWDFAITEEQQKYANWTVGVTVGFDSNSNLHILERVRIKTNDSSAIENAILDMYSRYKVISGFGVEDGQIWRTLYSSLKRRMIERGIFISITKENIMKPIREKMVRARPLQARMQNHKVTWPRGEVWVDEMIKEFSRFPAGAQDDQIDAMAWCTQLIVGKTPPNPPKPPKNRLEKTVAEKIRNYSRGGRNQSHMGA